jgi:hypothetical protein
MATIYTDIKCLTAYEIEGTDCIGDSRYYINTNTYNLGIATCLLSASLSAQNNRLTNSTRTLSTSITALSTTTNFLSSTVFTLRNNLTSLSASFNIQNVGPKTTLNTLVSSLSVFSVTGTYLGYIPIYM